jgi:hypothetical protein
VEATAKRSGRAEGELARLAIGLARDAATTAPPGAKATHVGY